MFSQVHEVCGEDHHRFSLGTAAKASLVQQVHKREAVWQRDDAVVSPSEFLQHLASKSATLHHLQAGLI